MRSVNCRIGVRRRPNNPFINKIDLLQPLGVGPVPHLILFFFNISVRFISLCMPLPVPI